LHPSFVVIDQSLYQRLGMTVREHYARYAIDL